MHGLTARGRRGQPLPGRYANRLMMAARNGSNPAMRPLKDAETSDARSRTRWRSYGRSLRLKRWRALRSRVSPFELPSGEATAVVAVVCPDFDCFVSLPASWWFTALSEKCSQRQQFEIPCLDDAKILRMGPLC